MEVSEFSCYWCQKELPEKGYDAWLIALDTEKRERPICISCERELRPVIVSVERRS
jgi:hypothetical protein